MLNELGHGAMGVVYAAEDPLIGRTVAIKTIRLAAAEGGENRALLVQRLHREAQAAGVLSHSSIVTIYDVGEQGEEAYIVMEYVDGRSVEEMIASDVLKHPETYLPILWGTAVAIDYAHGKGIIHRDIKPSNIMVCRDGAVKIADFGIAKLSESTSLTQSGFVIGTPSYMSPEQAQGRIVDGRADQFSLAVVAFRIVTGRLPFEGPTLTALLTKILWEEPEYESAGMSPALQPVFKRALSKDPQLRFPTCSDFVRGLEEVLAASESGGMDTAAGAPHEGSRFGQGNVPHAASRTTPSSEAQEDRAQKPDFQSPSVLPESAAGAPRRKLLWMGTAGLVFLALVLIVIFAFKADQKPAASVRSGDLNIAPTPSEEIAEAAPPSEPFNEAANPEAHTAQQPPPSQTDLTRNNTRLPPPQSTAALPDENKEASPGARVKQKEVQKAIAKSASPSQPDTVKAAAKETAPSQPDAVKAASKEAAQSQLSTVKAASKDTAPSRPGVTGVAVTEDSLSGEKQPENTDASLPPTSGVLTWSGKLGRNSILVISVQGASIGSIVGKFPGKPIRITLEPEGLIVRQLPSDANGWSQIILYSGNRIYSSITIRWSLVE
ncbi:MAG: protein kinase [Acidobacteria bacterium]|nr:protein kinase [Acidobacteriota bacterium]